MAGTVEPGAGAALPHLWQGGCPGVPGRWPQVRAGAADNQAWLGGDGHDVPKDEAVEEELLHHAINGGDAQTFVNLA
jgi:hypothetical protein